MQVFLLAAAGAVVAHGLVRQIAVGTGAPPMANGGRGARGRERGWFGRWRGWGRSDHESDAWERPGSGVAAPARPGEPGLGDAPG